VKEVAKVGNYWFEATLQLQATLFWRKIMARPLYLIKFNNGIFSLVA
jgi:hypothetical protein